MDEEKVQKYISELKCFLIEEFFTEGWLKNSSHLIELSVCMSLELSHAKEEFFSSVEFKQETIYTIVWELIATESWRNNVLPELMKIIDTPPTTTLPTQFIFQSELAAAGIIAFLLSTDSRTSLFELLILDVIDWSVRQIVKLISTHSQEATILPVEGKEVIFNTEDEKSLIIEEMEKETKKTILCCAIRGVEILHQVCIRRRLFPLCASSRLTDVHNIPQLISTLLHVKPWKREIKGQTFIFSNSQWVKQTSEHKEISALEAKQWLILYSLLMCDQDFGTYQFTPSTKEAFFKLKSQLSNAVDQIPDLEPLYRFISSLSFMTPLKEKSPCLIISMPQIGDSPWQLCKSKIKKVCALHFKDAFHPQSSKISMIASAFSSAFNFNTLELLSSESPFCSNCLKSADKRCSRCHVEWYCSRNCQVKNWPKHKTFCNLVSENGGGISVP